MRPRIDASSSRVHHAAVKGGRGRGGKKRMGDRFLIDAPNYTGCARVFRS